MRTKGELSDEMKAVRMIGMMADRVHSYRTFVSPDDRKSLRYDKIVEYTNCRSAFRRMLENRKIIALMAIMATDFMGDKVKELSDEVCDLMDDSGAMDEQMCLRIIQDLVAAGIPVKSNPPSGGVTFRARWHWEPLPWQLDMVDYYWRKAFAS